MAESSSDFLRSIADGCDFLDEPTCVCDLCEPGGDRKSAVGFCSDCRDYLCQECYDTHLRPKPTRHHVLLDRHQMPKDQQQDRNSDTCTEACAVHPHKTLEYFCADHSVFGCSACMTLHHRSCEGVDHIPDIAGDILSNVEYTTLQQRITSLTQLTTTAIKTSQDQVKRSESYNTTALEAFQNFKKDMSKAVDRMEKAFNAATDTVKQEDCKTAQMMEDKYKQALKGIQAIGSTFVSLQTSGQFCQLFIAMKRAKSEIDAIESQVIDKGQGTDVRNYRLVPSSETQMLLDSPETMVTLDIVTAADSDHGKPTHTATPVTTHQTLPSRQTFQDPVPGVTANENPHHPTIDTQAQRDHGKPVQPTDSPTSHQTLPSHQTVPALVPGVTANENPHHPTIDTQAQRVHGKPVQSTDTPTSHQTLPSHQTVPAPVPGTTANEDPHHPTIDTQAQRVHGKPVQPTDTPTSHQTLPSRQTVQDPVPGTTANENPHHPTIDTQAQRVPGKPVPSTDTTNSHQTLPSRQTVPAPVPGTTANENPYHPTIDTQAQRVHGKPVQPTDTPTSHQTLPSRQTVPVPVHDVKARAFRASLQQDRDVRKTRAHHVKDVRVRTRNDSETPNISGCVVLPGDKLVLVDCNNGNVKLADLTRGHVVSQLKLSEEIWDITQVSSTQVAVTSYSEQTICFVNVGYIFIWGHTLKLDRKVKLKGWCRGIARINDNLVVSYEKPVKVEVISMEGKVLQTVVTEDKGRQPFGLPHYIAVSRDQQTIYISDRYRHTVTSVDLAGRVQATYKDGKLRRPHGLTVDTAGTVYVCGWASTNVLQLTADLTGERQLLQRSDGVEYPGSVCYCEATDRLYVGMEHSSVVKVFQMK